jgi:hypothetical protein
MLDGLSMVSKWTFCVGREPFGGSVAKYGLSILEGRTARRAGTNCSRAQVGLYVLA